MCWHWRSLFLVVIEMSNEIAFAVAVRSRRIVRVIPEMREGEDSPDYVVVETAVATAVEASPSDTSEIHRLPFGKRFDEACRYVRAWKNAHEEVVK